MSNNEHSKQTNSDSAQTSDSSRHLANEDEHSQQEDSTGAYDQAAAFQAYDFGPHATKILSSEPGCSTEMSGKTTNNETNYQKHSEPEVDVHDLSPRTTVLPTQQSVTTNGNLKSAKGPTAYAEIRRKDGLMAFGDDNGNANPTHTYGNFSAGDEHEILYGSIISVMPPGDVNMHQNAGQRNSPATNGHGSNPASSSASPAVAFAQSSTDVTLVDNAMYSSNDDVLSPDAAPTESKDPRSDHSMCNSAQDLTLVENSLYGSDVHV